MSASVLPTPLMNRMLFVAEERQACMVQVLVENATNFDDERRNARRRPSDMVSKNEPGSDKLRW